MKKEQGCNSYRIRKENRNRNSYLFYLPYPRSICQANQLVLADQVKSNVRGVGKVKATEAAGTEQERERTEEASKAACNRIAWSDRLITSDPRIRSEGVKPKATPPPAPGGLALEPRAAAFVHVKSRPRRCEVAA